MKVLEVVGKDAREFLHRLFASNVNKLEVGKGNRGLLLNGQSKMIAQFDVLRKSEKVYWLVSFEDCFEELKNELERMHFSEELEMRERAEIFKFSPGESRGEGEFHFSDQWPSVVPGFVCEVGKGGVDEAFHFARIGALVPWPKKDWDSNTNALEAGVLPWIDRYKGCYPGQEVVEKSLNVGHPAKVLLAIEGEGNISEADGVICSRAERNGVTRILVRVPWKKKDLPAPGFKIIGTQF